MTGVLYRYNASTGLSEPVLPTPVIEGYSFCEANMSGGGVGQTIPNSTNTIVNFSGFGGGSLVDYTDDFTNDPSGAILIRRRGFYMVSGSLRWDTANTNNRRTIGIMVNSTQVIQSDVPASTLATTFNAQNVSATVYANAGDLIALTANQNSGQAGGLGIMADSGRTWITLARVGSSEMFTGDYTLT